jgi:WD40 repeat protein
VDVLTKQLRCKPWHAQNEHVSVLRVGFSSDSNTIISITAGGISLWDATTCTQRGPWLDTPEGYHIPLTSAAINPDSRLVVSGEIQGNLLLWDAMSGALRTEMRGHKQKVNSVSFSPDGKTIASAAEDGELRLWASATGQSIGVPIQGSKDALTSVIFSPDSRAIISGDSNGAVHVWDAPNAWIDRVCDKLVHNLSRSEWKQYVGDISYVEQCLGLPVPAD